MIWGFGEEAGEWQHLSEMGPSGFLAHRQGLAQRPRSDPLNNYFIIYCLLLLLKKGFSYGGFFRQRISFPHAQNSPSSMRYFFIIILMV